LRKHGFFELTWKGPQVRSLYRPPLSHGALVDGDSWFFRDV
jgi:hypothetical protein